MATPRATIGGLVGAAILLACSTALATPTTERVTRRAADHAAPDAVSPKLAESRALEARGRLVAALARLREALAAMETGEAPESALADLRRHVEELDRAVPRVVLVGSLPPGAVLWLDGASRGEARTFALDPGDHVVAVEAPGRTRWHGTFHVERGWAREIAVQTGPALDFEELPAVAHEPHPELARSPFLRPTGAPARVAGELRLVMPRVAPVVRAVEDPGGIRLCARETCGPAAPRVPGGDERIDKTILRQVVAGTGMNVSSNGGMILFSTSGDVVAPNTRLAAGMTSEKAVLALTGRW